MNAILSKAGSVITKIPWDKAWEGVKAVPWDKVGETLIIVGGAIGGIVTAWASGE